MSSELDEVARALFNGQIPNIWRKLAPATLKSLGNWMEHFLKRLNQYSQWVTTVFFFLHIQHNSSEKKARLFIDFSLT